MTRVAFLVLLAVACAQAQEAWRSQVGPAEPGPFPGVRPFTGTFRFGWSGIGAAHANASFRLEGDRYLVKVEGGTDGFARRLWRMDANHSAWVDRTTLQSTYFRQFEKYAGRTVTTEVVFKPGDTWRLRRVDPDPTHAAKWKRVKVAPLRGIVAALLFIRSQPLRDGDRVGLLVYPGDSPFLVETEVAGRTRIKIAGAERAAIKMRFRIHKIDTKHGNRLVPHEKFRRGTVWVSDDPDRIPLRAEVDIFIGYVFGELDSIRFGPQPR